MKWVVEVKDKKTKEVIETVPAEGKRDAEVILMGVRQNLDHANYMAMMTPKSK